MQTSQRKYPTIDILELYSTRNYVEWNNWLYKCLINHDIESLKKTRYGLQAGMSDLAKQQMNTDTINNWFIRANRSIEITLKRILRIKYKNPSNEINNPNASVESLAAKRIQDKEFEKFLRESAF